MGRHEGLTWDDVDRAKKARADASICCRCGKALPPDGPFWMLECTLAWPYHCVGGWITFTQDVTAAGCAECAKEEARRPPPSPQDLWWRAQDWYPTWSGDCPGCVRMVPVLGAYRRSYRGVRQPHVPFCSDRCRNRIYGARFRKRHPRPKRPRPVVACQVCAENFAPQRAGAKTCSPACRQK